MVPSGEVFKLAYSFRTEGMAKFSQKSKTCVESSNKKEIA
jgi:hypothetical protein